MAIRLSSLISALPGCLAQGIVWGIMALGLYITFRVLEFSDLTVDGSFATGGAVTVMMILAGKPVWIAVLTALFAGILCGLPAYKAGYRADPGRDPDADRSVLRQSPRSRQQSEPGDQR